MAKHKMARRQAVAKQSKAINDVLLKFVKHCEKSGSGKPTMYYVHVNTWINKAFNIGDRSKDVTPYQIELLEVFTPLLSERVNHFIESGIDYHQIKAVVFKCLNDSVNMYMERLKAVQRTRMIVIDGGSEGLNKAVR